MKMKGRSHRREKILDIALEMICLVTGEVCSVVKTSGEVVAPRGTRNPIAAPPSNFLLHGKDDDQKILELTNQIIELLTREKHEEPNEEIRKGDLPPLTSPDPFPGGPQDTISPSPDYGICTGPPTSDNRAGTHTLENMAEPVTLPRCDITPPTDIKEEASQSEEVHLVDSPSPSYLVDGPPGHIKDEEEEGLINVSCIKEDLSREVELPPRLEINTATKTAQCRIKEESVSSDAPGSAQLKEETTSDEEEEEGPINVSCNKEDLSREVELPPRLESNTATKTAQCHITEESVSSDARGSAHLKEETTSDEDEEEEEEGLVNVSCIKDDLSKEVELPLRLETNTATKTAQCRVKEESVSSDARGSAHLKEETTSGEETLSEADDHTTANPIEYTTFVIKEETLSDVDSDSNALGGRVQETRPYVGRCSRNYLTNPTIEKPFSCSECGKRFQHRSKLVSHQRGHTGQKPFACAACNKSFNCKTDCQTHERIHTGERPYSCAACGKSFNVKSNLVTHRRIHTGEKPYGCSECGKCFISNSNLATHQRIHTGEKPYACPDCGRCFSNKSEFNRHQRSHTGEKPYPCAECGKRFISKAELNSHRKVHAGHKPYSCQECGKAFSRKMQFVTHQWIHTGEKQHSCSDCGKRFSSKSNLVTHRKIHSGHKQYVCPACGKCFINSSNLALHRKIHSGDRPFSCSECGKGFITNSQLVAHRRSHTGEKPYACADCGKGFGSSSECSRHKRVHTGERPYACSQCQKSYICKSNLVIHLRTHTGEKPFPCSECGKAFISNSDLIKHQRIHAR